ncbi:O-antigen ligase family protein [Winogradskyella endarachnes]|uniref:O-antigen ligase-related domain-containing protein n=1 Tax=Winogradskyella endarachnes TaxID=2681965 RepID=A0A6L6U8N7_9FLAO|nr:O-antigen ligase family protein [Winogradskyella endarachnes]MUU77876.1 hypothetical protein [Winogradskyella endarachnes]
MQELYNCIQLYKKSFLWLLAIVLGGILGGFIGASLLCAPLLFVKNKVLQIETLLLVFLIIFIFGDNYKNVLSFAQNSRFVILGISLLILFRYNLLQSIEAIYILPFSIIATFITYFNSNFGMEAVLRGVSYFLVALVVFKITFLLIDYNAKRFYNLLVTILSIYFALNLFVFFVPFIGEIYIKGRFMGLMANPNGLAMVSLISYGIIDVIKKIELSSFKGRYLTIFKLGLLILIVLSGSRTAIFSLLIYEIIIRLLKYRLLLFVVLLLIIYIYGISASLNINSVIDSLGLSSFLRTESLEDASGRTEVWAVAVEEIKNQPWLGKGMLYDSYFINSYADRFIGEVRARHWSGIWNSYLSLLLNVGVIGLLAFSFFWYKMFALSQMKIVRFAFLLLCLFSAISESWMAASMNAFMPLVFLCWGLQINQTKSISV